MIGKPHPGPRHFFDDGVSTIRARDVELPIHESVGRPAESTPQRIYMHKDRRALTREAAILDHLNPRRGVEVGVMDGASVIYWAERFALEGMVAFDIAAGAPCLSDYIDRHGLSGTICPCFGVSQDDGPALRAVMAREFADPVDFVIDDASHMHRETRDTLETLLPWVRPGGVYLIEDWAWAHEKDWPEGQWADRPLLSPLIAEVMLICGAGRGVIDRMEINPNFVALWRGPEALDRTGGFRLEDHYVARDFPVIRPVSR